MNNKMLHIAKSIFKQNLIAKQIFSDLFTDDADFSDDQVKLDVGLFVGKPATNLYSAYKAFIGHNNSNQKYEPFVKKHGFLFDVYQFDFQGKPMLNNVMYKNLTIEQLLKIFQTTKVLFGQGEAVYSQITKSIRNLLKNKKDIDAIVFVNDYFQLINQLQDITNKTKLLGGNSIRTYAKGLTAFDTKLKKKVFTIDNEEDQKLAEEIKKQILGDSINNNFNALTQIEENGNTLTNVFKTTISPQFQGIVDFYNIYKRLKNGDQRVQLDFKALQIIDNLTQLNLFREKIKSLITGDQITVTQQFKDKLDNIESVEQLMQWIQDPYKGYKNSQVTDPYVKKKYEDYYSENSNKEYETKNIQLDIQSFLNLLFERSINTPRGRDISKVLNAIKFLKQQESVLNNTLKNGKTVRDALEEIKKQCEELDENSYKKISLYNVNKLGNEKIDKKYNQKYKQIYNELLSKIDKSLSKKQINDLEKNAKINAEEESENFVREDREKLNKKIIGLREMFRDLSQRLLSLDIENKIEEIL